MRHFSDRHGYSTDPIEITVREDAPDDLRYAVAQIARSAGLTPKAIRNIVCQVLFVAPDPNNWSEYPNIWEEALRLLRDCEWFKVYDIAEAMWRSLEYNDESQQIFQDELNRCFSEKGIGWELKDPEGIVFRGGATFAATTKETVRTLNEAGKTTAAAEIQEALRDISRRPEPDRTGAVQHAIAALECTARDLLGASGTLGKLISQLDLPRPLDMAVEKLWGFASDRARHLREGEAISDDEAELVVTVACAICDFLVRRA